MMLIELSRIKGKSEWKLTWPNEQSFLDFHYLGFSTFLLLQF